MNVYLAGPLFSKAERAYLSECAAAFRKAGMRCFVPHERSLALRTPSARSVFRLDALEGLMKAHALVAWLDGAAVDDGTACEIGIFWGLLQKGEPWRKGILGLATDLRLHRRRRLIEQGGLNLFVAGVIQDAGAVCWSLDEVVRRLRSWKSGTAGA